MRDCPALFDGIFPQIVAQFLRTFRGIVAQIPPRRLALTRVVSHRLRPLSSVASQTHSFAPKLDLSANKLRRRFEIDCQARSPWSCLQSAAQRRSRVRGARFSSSGSLAMLAAMRRASSRVSSLAPPRNGRATTPRQGSRELGHAWPRASCRQTSLSVRRERRCGLGQSVRLGGGRSSAINASSTARISRLTATKP
jgi:hypothetical protein